MLYRPSPSLMTVRTFSISAGLAASTVTPGSAPPDVSLITPAMPLACCAHAADDSSRHESTNNDLMATLIVRCVISNLGLSACLPFTRCPIWIPQMDICHNGTAIDLHQFTEPC